MKQSRPNVNVRNLGGGAKDSLAGMVLVELQSIGADEIEGADVAGVKSGGAPRVL
jgi:hypothetical protein